MIRKALAVAFLMTMAACGQSGPDFAVDVNRSAGQTQARLMALDGGGVQQLPGFAPLAITTPEPGQIRYGFYNGAGEEAGTLLLRIEAIGQNNVRIHATLDLPSIEYAIDGEQMVLSESRAEDTLEEELQAWAQGFAETGYGSLDDINATLAALSIAVQPEQLAALEDPGYLDGLDMDFVGSELSYDEESLADGGWGGAPQEQADAKDSFVDPYALSGDDGFASEEDGGFAYEDDGYGY